jgi:NADH:ubiquinone oxidoreductase subunit 6 (subunit J)
MDWSLIIFYAFGAIALLSALFILFTRNILYAAFALMLTFLGVAGIFIFSGAEFVAITQILVYVGGILILIVFGVMLTNKVNGKNIVTPVYRQLTALIIGGGFFVLFIKAIMQANFGAISWIANGTEKEPSSLKHLGLVLMTDYMLAFEVIGILLLIALIGAVYMAGAKRKEAPNAN